MNIKTTQFEYIMATEKKRFIESSPILTAYINSLTNSRDLVSDELGRSHPYSHEIHRKSQIVASDCKYNLGLARSSPKEYIMEDDGSVHMNQLQIGMSCSKSCVSKDFTLGQFVYPFDILKPILGTLISRCGDDVAIGRRECITFKCFHRIVNRTVNHGVRTVRDALSHHGKDDAFLIDNSIDCKFSFYWDSSDHCTLCLRNPIVFSDEDAAQMMKGGRESIVFNDIIFRRSEWIKCEYLGVKLPDIYFHSVFEDKKWVVANIPKKIEAMEDKKLQLLIRAFLTAFDVSCQPDDNSKINETLLYMIGLTSFDELNSEHSKVIVKIIDLFESEIFGGKSSEWSDNLRPTLSNRA